MQRQKWQKALLITVMAAATIALLETSCRGRQRTNQTFAEGGIRFSKP